MSVVSFTDCGLTIDVSDTTLLNFQQNEAQITSIIHDIGCITFVMHSKAT